MDIGRRSYQVDVRSPVCQGALPRGCERLGLLALFALLAITGCENQAKGYRFGSIEGRAVFMGAVADAPVKLVRLEDGVVAETMATVRTDAEGRFVFRPLVADYGVYRAEVDLTGLTWAYHGRTGSHLDGLTLTATLTDYDRYADRRLSVNAYTTLTDAIAESLRRTRDGSDADERARAGFVAHLELDPAQTEIGDPLGDVALDPTHHRLLVDAFDALGETLGSAAGVDETAIYPGQVLLGLMADALGDQPAGRFDGLAIGGPVYIEAGTTLLDPEALRHHLASSVRYVVENDPRWAAVTPAAVAPIARQLACSASSLFARCDPESVVDPTPPFIDAVDPAPGTPLSGVVDFQVRAHEPDGTLARVEFQLRINEIRTPVPALPGPGHVFRVDTAAIVGVDRLDAEVVVVNGAGLEARRELSWPLTDRTSGTLSGYVFKGKAQNARVRAYDVSNPPLLLGTTTTDDNGAFGLDIVAYSGPVILEVSDDPAAEASRPTVHDDEVRGARRWRSGRTLKALVPEFRSIAPSASPIVVTPFTDMALARARRAEADGGFLVAAYERALGALAAQLGLEGNAEALLSTLPAPTDQAVLNFEASEKLAFALGCFSAQADALAQTTFPDAPEAFDALDLVALYRLDLANDPYLDGKDRNAQVVLTVSAGEVRLPSDPFRVDFVAGCGRWLNHPANGMEVDSTEAARHFSQIAGFAHPDLYDPRVPPTPYDEDPPAITFTLTAPDAEAGGVFQGVFPEPGSGPNESVDLSTLSTMRGEVSLIVDAHDPSGISTLLLAMDGISGSPPWVLDTEVVDPFHTRMRARISSDLLAERIHDLLVTRTDQLTNTATTRHLFAVDRTPPTLMVSSPDLNFVGDSIYTNRSLPTEVAVTWNDEGATKASATINGAQQFSESSSGGAASTSMTLALDRTDEGVFELEVEVSDLTGLTTTFTRQLKVDRTPPTYEIVPSTYHDELAMPANRDTSNVPVITLGERGGLVRRWQTAWRDDADNPSWLNINLSDGARPEASPPEGVRLRYSVCMLAEGDQCLGGPRMPLDEFAGDEPGIQITAGLGLGANGRPMLIDFDLATVAVPPERVQANLIDVVDLAGNVSPINTAVAFDIEVVAPAVDVQILNTLPPGSEPDGVVILERMDIAGGDLVRSHRGLAALFLHRVVINNPHPIPVTVSVGLPGTYRLSSVISEVFSGERLADFDYSPPSCGDGTVLGPIRNDRYIDPESCTVATIPGVGTLKRCNDCIGHAPANLREAFNVPFEAPRAHTGGVRLVLQQLLGAAPLDHWEVTVGPESESAIDISSPVRLSNGSAWQSGVAVDRDFGQSAFEFENDVLRYIRAGDGEPAFYESGRALVLVDQLRTTSSSTNPGRVGAVLHGQMTFPHQIPSRPAQTVDREPLQ